MQFAVRSARRTHGADRDEPARLPLVGAGLARPPASRSRRSPRCSRLATGSTRSRTTSRARRPAAFEPTLDYVVVKIPRFAFEKFPGGGPEPDVDDEVGRRGHGDRTDVQGGVRQGAARSLERTGYDAGRSRRSEPAGHPGGSRTADGGPARARWSGRSCAGHTVDEVAAASRIDPWFVDQIAQVVEGADALRGRPLVDVERATSCAARSGWACPTRASPRSRASTDAAVRAAPRGARRRAGLQDRGHLRRGVRGAHAVPLLDVRGRDRGAARREAARGDPGRRAEPDRAGDRVRLRVRARRVRAARRPASSR